MDDPKQTLRLYPFNLMYDPEPNSNTYERLVILCSNLLEALKPLGARDYRASVHLDSWGA